MTSLPRLRHLNPLRLFQKSRFSYQQIPSLSAESLNGAIQLTSERWTQGSLPWREGRRKCGFGRMSVTKSIMFAIAGLVIVSLLAGGGYHQHRKNRKQPEEDVPYGWMHYNRLNGYYNGIRTLVPPSQYVSENGYNITEPISMQIPDKVPPPKVHDAPPVDPVKFDPYPDYKSAKYLQDHHKVETCYLDPTNTIEPPDVYAYPGVPQHMSQPMWGTYKELGLQDEMCFERFGRYAGYGYGFNETHKGMGPGLHCENRGADKIFAKTQFTDFENIDWGDAQKRCYQRNKKRFEDDTDPLFGNKTRVKRQAYILRTWTGFEYSPHQIYAMRAMINELSLKSGGEYDVHLLVHVKDNSIPIWADEGVYRRVLEENVPREFWNIATLWSEIQMVMYYPEPFPGNFANMAGAGIHGVYRSAHFALQWFSRQFPDYDQYWNWEMDLRFTGHYYEFHNKIGEWGRKQPRKGLWERGRRFYFPEYHGDWQNFTKFVEWETAEVDPIKHDVVKSGPLPIWGPVKDFPNDGMMDSPPGTVPPTTYEEDNYEWGVGEDADLLVFNPLFDPALTNWVFSWDISGYNATKEPPPRRAAIITVARLSKRLLDTMHKEVWSMKHTMFPEMWPPSVALHHGLKAVYVPHPVYFDRDWDLSQMNQVFNYPAHEFDSPFGWGEHNMLGSSFYYNSGFSGALWRRWLGQWENGEGGWKQEEEASGRLCLRPILHHPIKHEHGPEGDAP